MVCIRACLSLSFIFLNNTQDTVNNVQIRFLPFVLAFSRKHISWLFFEGGCIFSEEFALLFLVTRVFIGPTLLDLVSIPNATHIHVSVLYIHFTSKHSLPSRILTTSSPFCQHLLFSLINFLSCNHWPNFICKLPHTSHLNSFELTHKLYADGESAQVTYDAGNELIG